MNKVETYVSAKSFELLSPFLQEWQEMNPGSTVDWFVDDENQIEHVFV